MNCKVIHLRQETIQNKFSFKEIKAKLNRGLIMKEETKSIYLKNLGIKNCFCFAGNDHMDDNHKY